MERKPGGYRTPNIPTRILSVISAENHKKYQKSLVTKLVRERLYDAACFLMSNATDGPRGVYREPAPELNFANFISSLLAKAMAGVLNRFGETPVRLHKK
jgi:hypothetical protein